MENFLLTRFAKSGIDALSESSITNMKRKLLQGIVLVFMHAALGLGMYFFFYASSLLASLGLLRQSLSGEFRLLSPQLLER